MTYLHHAALNLGAALSSLVWMLVPPVVGHSPADRGQLRRGTTWAWFLYGLGVGRKP